jgi:hypothetical protein
MSDFSADARNNIALKSIEDLIKIADELAKPVIFQEPEPGRDLYLYYVLDGTTRYQYFVKRD